jgi:hypothetical protein
VVIVKEEDKMERFAELLSIYLQHSQKFLDIWNIQIVILLAILGFVFSNPDVAAKRFVRVAITIVFAFIAIFSAFSLGKHQQREESLFAAIESRVMAAPADYTPQELEYLDALKPTSFGIKISALLLADVFVIVVIWIFPRQQQNPINQDRAVRKSKAGS